MFDNNINVRDDFVCYNPGLQHRVCTTVVKSYSQLLFENHLQCVVFDHSNTEKLVQNQKIYVIIREAGGISAPLQTCHTEFVGKAG